MTMLFAAIAHSRFWHEPPVRCGAIFRPLLNELRNELVGSRDGSP